MEEQYTCTGLVRKPSGSVMAKLRAMNVGDSFACESWERRSYGSVAGKLKIGVSFDGKARQLTRVR